MNERKKVLVIEDDAETAKYHAQRLYLFGFDCDLTYDGRTALDMLRTREYELALVDIRLPDINGLELLNVAEDDDRPSRRFRRLKGKPRRRNSSHRQVHQRAEH